MTMSAFRIPILLASLALGGCASTHNNPKDPFESFNRGVYRFNDAVDQAVIKPAAKGYSAAIPPPARMMVSNFFSNLDDVIVTANDLLQLKVVQAIADSGRILVNTTVGLYGLVDLATVVGLPKHREDFGQTLGFWGVGDGPYLVLPILGPSTVRDSIGDLADSHLGIVKNVKQVDTRNQLLATDLLNKRAKLLDGENVLDEAMIDRYSFIRDAYLQRRLNRIYDGNPPREKFEDEEDDSPGKTSATDVKGASPFVAETVPVTPPVAAISNELPTPQQAEVSRIWLSQH
jgi:phospholipid-binding lipoprotein MlaA